MNSTGGIEDDTIVLTSSNESDVVNEEKSTDNFMSDFVIPSLCIFPKQLLTEPL